MTTTAAALAPVVRPVGGADAERLWRDLDEGFLADAGWNPTTQTLAPAADHPLLGFRCCTVRGCPGHALPDGLCATCRRVYQRSNLGMAEFITVGPMRTKHRGETICAVDQCPRPARNRRLALCTTHEHRRKRLDMLLVDFLAHPEAAPLAGFGWCRVAVCERQAHCRRGLCRAHDVRWWELRRVDAAADFDTWCGAAAPVANGHTVVLRGLTPLVQAQILFGLQQRCRRDALTYLYQLRIFCRGLLSAHATTIVGFDVNGLPGHHRALALDLQQAVLRAGITPEDEQRNDVWNLALLGHGRRRVMDFTGISQLWLREAVKGWVSEELPTRRGDHVTGTLREHVRRVEELSVSLRLHRVDHGNHPTRLGREDIIAFLNRLKHRESTGQISAFSRSTTCRQVAMILRECRALGLTRAGRPMAGLPDDFALRRDDIPQLAADDEPGRALPGAVLNQLIAALPILERDAGSSIRVAVELLADTGRRPAEVSKLGWDCLGQDSDGKYVLVYTDFKNNRAGRRLPITDATAQVILTQQHRVRSRFPDTPAGDLVLFPRTTRNPAGTRPSGDQVLASKHRGWVNDLPPLRLEDGREFDKAAVILYAYRHSFAQRHADAGTPVDVLRDVMGHRSMTTTQGYYSVTAPRVRAAVDHLATFQFDRSGDRVWRETRSLLDSEHQRLAVGQVSVPFGVCTEPSNVKAGGGACPFRFRCLGCGHFRSDPSYLPELRDYLDTLLSSRERIRSALELDDWARADATPPEEEITRLRQLIRRIEDDLTELDAAEQQQIHQAVQAIRSTRQNVHLGMPGTRPPAPDPRLEGGPA